jgi:hypothetical protein
MFRTFIEKYILFTLLKLIIKTSKTKWVIDREGDVGLVIGRTYIGSYKWADTCIIKRLEDTFRDLRCINKRELSLQYDIDEQDIDKYITRLVSITQIESFMKAAWSINIPIMTGNRLDNNFEIIMDRDNNFGEILQLSMKFK